MKSTAAVLSIDIGTSSTRAALFDLAGMPHGPASQRANLLRTDATGMAEIDPEALARGVIEAIDQVLKASPDTRILGVGISCFWHSLLGLDAHGAPTTAVLSWADRRAGAIAAGQREPGHRAAALRPDTGCPVHSSYWTAKLPWLRQSRPVAWAATAHWVSAADHLLARLFGDLGTSVSMASGTGLFDLWSLGWHPEALAVADVPVSMLPPVTDQPRTQLVPEFAQRWPRLQGVPWFPVTGDGACSNIGVGGIDRDTLVLMLGTSGSMRVVWDAHEARLDDPGLWCYRVDARRLAGGMAMSEGGASAAWTRGLFEGATPDLDAQVAAMAPDSHGLAVLPYVLGARSPDWIDGRTACIAGITAATSGAQIHRAMLESVGLRFAGLKQQLEARMRPARRIVVTGGALSRSATWRQIVADCIGQDVQVSAIDEASLRGAALLALERLGVGELADFGFEFTEHVRFDAGAHQAYLGALERQLRFDAAMKGAGF